MNEGKTNEVMRLTSLDSALSWLSQVGVQRDEVNSLISLYTLSQIISQCNNIQVGYIESNVDSCFGFDKCIYIYISSNDATLICAININVINV